MATQTFVRREQSYNATLNFSGADADLVVSTYQVFLSVFHEWGDSIFTVTKLSSAIAVGDIAVQVFDGSVFSVGDHVVVHDGNPEYRVISAITDNTLTLDDVFVSKHNAGVQVALEQETTRDSANNYSYTLSSDNLSASGVYKLRWRYVQSSTSTIKENFLNVYQPYITEDEFFDLHEDLEDDFSDPFISFERRVRAKIDTYCGQSFDFFRNQTLVFDGSGKNSLYTGLRLEQIHEVILKPDEDITELVEITHGSNFFVSLSSRTSKFGEASEFAIRGDWGWSNVPSNITMAADLLLADDMNDDSQYVKHGIKEVYMDTHRMAFDQTIFGSTGNLDADVLLMDYTLFVVGLI